MSTLQTVGSNFRADQNAKHEVIDSISKVTAHFITPILPTFVPIFRCEQDITIL